MAGPQAWWMQVMGNMPQCNDLRSQYWRPLSYQLVHSGYNHIIFNALTQLFFGLPVRQTAPNERTNERTNLPTYLLTLETMLCSHTHHDARSFSFIRSLPGFLVLDASLARSLACAWQFSTNKLTHR